MGRTKFLMPTNFLPGYYRWLFRILISSLLVLTLLRVGMLFYVAGPAIEASPDAALGALQKGLQFDLVVLSYLFALPFLLLFISSYLRKWQPSTIGFLSYYFSITLTVGWFLCLADLPYFKFFHNRLTESAFQWMGSPKMVASMIAGETENVLFLIADIAGAIWIAIASWKGARKFIHFPGFFESSQRGLLAFVTVVALFMGMRGKIDRPIRQGDAFYTNDPILNQVGLNPVFTLLKSYTDQVGLMNDQLALKNVQEILGIEKEGRTPIARIQAAGPVQRNCNVVLVLMESMSANFMSYGGQKLPLTPTLDSMVKEGLFFTEAYSAGIHTNNGVFSTLYSFPALKRTRPMSTVPLRSYTGIPYTLKQQGYRNLFFTSHDPTFDNLGTFLPANYFDRVYSASDYPEEELLGTFGAPDEFLFKYACQTLDSEKGDRPFFATILTTSNHEPYAIPEQYRCEFEDPAYRAVHYADHAIQGFLDQVKQKAWYSNTLFIFVADHGLVVGENAYDLPLSYHHIPILFFQPSLLGQPKTLSGLMGQIDVYPTLMNLLGIGFENNTLGVDVIHSDRPAIYFSADTKIGCLSKDHLLVHRFGGSTSLYRYRDGDQKDYATSEPGIFEQLKDFAFSQIQCADFFFRNNLSGPPEPKK